jgi:GxxExxY protein
MTVLVTSMRSFWRMRFVNPKYRFSELTRDVIAGFYRTYDALGFGFLESVYRRALSVELRHAGVGVQREVPFELFHLGEWIGRYRADLIVERTLIVEVKRGALLDPEAIPQLLNYLNVTRLSLGLMLFFGPKPKVRRLIRDSSREYPVISH